MTASTLAVSSTDFSVDSIETALGTVNTNQRISMVVKGNIVIIAKWNVDCTNA